MTQIIPIRQGIALRELMCGKHERPWPVAALDAAVKIVARRVATGSTLTHRQHLSIWLDHPNFIPLVSICDEFRRLVR